MTYQELIAKSTTDGAIDPIKLDSFRTLNGGTCDVMDGPCACGAWHKPCEHCFANGTIPLRSGPHSKRKCSKCGGKGFN
jgi:hypothetical protein